MTRPLRAVIHPAALAHNLNVARKFAPQSKVMAVVKADAYGHGLAGAVQGLQAADGFGLLTTDQAIHLREMGVDKPLCLLEGFFEPYELTVLAGYGVAVTLHSEAQLRVLETTRFKGPLDVWVKLDTGMHRIGFSPGAVADVMQRLLVLDNVRPIGFMSHLANADQVDDPATEKQLKQFVSTCSAYTKPKSLANSAAVVAWPATYLDWVRPGIMLYGSSPVAAQSAQELGLQPAMDLDSALISIKDLSRGDRVGYGGTWVCPHDMRIGVVAAGYGDGYPRHAPQGTPILVKGRVAPLVGRVSMDMITLDLSQHDDVQVGDPVRLWGQDLDIDAIAKRVGTIAYELMCGVTARVPRVYNDHGG
ncbi:MAG TPA: alanine racemase [Acidiferrobacteraceae bacterium]|nr:alanine racemase [Acidiferrobacteraceae bacterium]